MSRGWQVIVVDRNGAAIARLPSAVVQSVSRELNKPGQIDVLIPVTEPSIAEASEFRELQVRRPDGSIAGWGVIVRRQVQSGSAVLQCPGLLWYFSKRVVGRANRTNWVTNGSFETGSFTGWSLQGVTAGVVTTHRTSGAYAAELIQAGAGADSYIYQNILANGLRGSFLTVEADMHIYGDFAYLGPGLDQRGLTVELVYPPGGAGDVHGFANAAIDETYQAGKTYHMQTGIAVPADAPTGSVVQVRCYAVGGHIMWDDVEGTLMESLAFDMQPQEAILEGVIAHAQDTAYGKTDLNIGVASWSPTVLRSEAFQFVDHANIGQIIDQYTAMDDGPEVSVEVTDTSRNVHVWAQKGVDRGDYPLTLTGRRADSCTGEGFGFSADGDQAISDAIVQGEGSGPGRPEGYASDRSFTNGIAIEQVYSAVSGASRDSLAGLAGGRVRTSKAATRTVTLQTKADAGYAGHIDEGDRVPVHVDYCGVVLAETMRVVRVTEYPNGVLACVCNPL